MRLGWDGIFERFFVFGWVGFGMGYGSGIELMRMASSIPKVLRLRFRFRFRHLPMDSVYWIFPASKMELDLEFGDENGVRKSHPL